MRIPLDGPDWLLRGFLGDEWEHHGAHRPDLRHPQRWLNADVPGSVLDTLRRAGMVADPYHGRNSLLAEWVPQRTWVYRRRFGHPALSGGQRATLCFDGIDHAAEVYLDGQRLGRHEGMFTPAVLDVTELVRAGGEHLLAVVVEPAPVSEPQVGHTARVRAHKSRMGYGWDFCPRLVHQGIWQSVGLEVTGVTRLADVWARPVVASDHAEVAVTVARDGPAVPVTLELADPDGRPVATGTVPAGQDRATLHVARPRLWWPNGLGDQPLYTLTARTADGSASTAVPVGLRRLEYVRADGVADDALPYGIVVNGRRPWLKGWNWVPQDALYGVPRPDRLAHLLTLARDAGVTLLRVWGGGLIETPAFYRLCDRLGLLVWQEFSQSSSGITSTPAGDADFVDLMRRDAGRIVRGRRNHPSLAIWCGGNELQDERGAPLDGRAPVLAALRETVRRLDPDRLFLPTSPSGPGFLNREDVIAADPTGQHDVHGPWEHQGLADHYRRYDAGTCHLLSEFGVEGMASPRVLNAVVPEADRRLPTTGSPVWDHLGRWWNNEPLVRDSFGDRLDTLAAMGRASQYLQADGLRYAVEAHRRRAFRSVGVIVWQFDEPFPNGWCTAAVDHTGTAKPAYHAVRRAYRPRHVCAQLDRQSFAGHDTLSARVWAWSDDGFPGIAASAGLPVHARFLDLTGAVLAERCFRAETPDPAAVALGELSVPAADAGTDVVLLDLAMGEGEDRVGNRYLLTRTAHLGGLVDLPPARVEVDLAVPQPDEWLLTLTHHGGPVAPFLRLLDARPPGAPGFWSCSDNGVDLLPGEHRRLSVRWQSVPRRDRQLRLDGWNVTARTLTDPEES